MPRLGPAFESTERGERTGDHERRRRALALSRIRGDLVEGVVSPTRLGRFTLLEHLGSGGFGSVYAAHDPVLDREVALKLLEVYADASDALIREARALGKLSHPHVVSVHEVVEVGNQVVLVMELVKGTRLDVWVRQQEPSVDAIVRTFAGAAAGLFAAHESGLVHRDIKPSNVLVDEEGNARIVDFGLARADPTASSDDGLSGTSPGSSATSRAGTPQYWAPEVRAGGAASVKSDQYAFCLSLRRVFEDSGRVIPPWAARIVARGLERQPSGRWNDMRAVEAQLRRNPARRRRYVGLAIVATAIVTGPWVLQTAAAQRAEARCQSRSTTLADQWSGARAERVGEAFQATGLDYAAEAWGRVEPQLDAYPQRWEVAFQDACAVDDHEADASPALMCLEQQGRAFTSLVELMDEPRDGTVRRAAAAVADLPAPQRCAQADWPRLHPLPDRTATARQVQQLRAELRQVSWRRLTRDPELALSSARELHDRANVVGWEPLIAEVELEIGRVHRMRGEFDDATASLQSAYRRAGAAGFDRVAAEAAIALCGVQGSELAQTKQALVWAESARMLLDKMGDEGRRRAQLHSAIGGAHQRAGDFREAFDEVQLAVELHRGATDSNRLGVANEVGNLALIEASMGDWDAAVARFEESVALETEVFGPNHPSVIRSVVNLAGLELQRGNFERALEHNDRALAGSLRLGDDHPEVLGILGNQAVIRMRLGQLDRALAVAQRVSTARHEVLGPDHPDTIMADNNIAAIYMHRGRWADAEETLSSLLQRQRRIDEVAPIDVARTLHNLAAVRVQRKNTQAAREAFGEASEMFERALGPTHLDVLRSQEGEAVALIDLGQLDEAAALLGPVLEKRRDVQPPADPEIAMTLRNLGLVAMHRGHLHEAVARFEESIAVYEAGDTEDWGTGALLQDLGDALIRLGRRGQARASYERALRIRTEVLGPQHPETQESAAALQGL